MSTQKKIPKKVICNLKKISLKRLIILFKWSIPNYIIIPTGCQAYCKNYT